MICGKIGGGGTGISGVVGGVPGGGTSSLSLSIGVCKIEHSSLLIVIIGSTSDVEEYTCDPGCVEVVD